MSDQRAMASVGAGVTSQTAVEARRVLSKITTQRDFITEEVKHALRYSDFDMWLYSKEQLVFLIEQIFLDMGFVEQQKLDREVLLNFLWGLHDGYNITPFHNFYHCFCVTQMTYSILFACKDREKFIEPIEKFALIVSACCHDLDHPGLNNFYQINARSDLAQRYNDVAPLENHHCAQCFSLLSRSECNLIKEFTPAQYKAFRKVVVACIFATDMAKHFPILEQYNALVANFNWTDANHRQLLTTLILMCADISNEVRPWAISRRWADQLTEEFGNQADREKREGLPFLPFMDRSQVVVEQSQLGFIGGILRPLWVDTAKVLPELLAFVDRIDVNYHKWSEILDHNNSRMLMSIVSNPAEFPRVIKRNYAEGDTVVRKGDRSREMYFLVKGMVNVVGDGDQVWETLKEGCFFGEIVAFKDIPRTANVVAKMDCEILIVDKDDVHVLLEKYPEQASKIRAVADERYSVTMRLEDKFDRAHLVELGG